jgi:hypothetical protein
MKTSIFFLLISVSSLLFANDKGYTINEDDNFIRVYFYKETLDDFDKFYAYIDCLKLNSTKILEIDTKNFQSYKKFNRIIEIAVNMNSKVTFINANKINKKPYLPKNIVKYDGHSSFLQETQEQFIRYLDSGKLIFVDSIEIDKIMLAKVEKK